MKKILLSLTLLIILAITLPAQWIQQASGFTIAQRGIWNISIVDQNIAWASSYDGSGGGDPTQDFTRTINAGGQWVSGTISVASGLDFSDFCGVTSLTAYALFCGNTTGGQSVFKTTDGGATWNNQATASFSGSSAFPDIIYFWSENDGVCIGDPNGGYMEIYTTTDGGTTWIRTPSANIPAIISGEYGYNGGNDYDVIGDTIWFGTNKGRVFKSVDRGLNWTVATTNLTEVSRLAFKDALNGLAMYTGTTIVLKSTTDGGITWNNVTKTGPCYENAIAYAHGNPGYYVTTGSDYTTAYGSSYSLDDGVTWITVDTLVQHTALAFLDDETGWSGGFNDDQYTNGIYKWTGISVGKYDIAAGNSEINVFPNPTYGKFTITFTNKEAGDAEIHVLDITGRIIKDININLLTSQAILVDISSCNAGPYLVEITSGNTKSIKKIFKK